MAAPSMVASSSDLKLRVVAHFRGAMVVLEERGRVRGVTVEGGQHILYRHGSTIHGGLLVRSEAESRRSFSRRDGSPGGAWPRARRDRRGRSAHPVPSWQHHPWCPPRQI